MLELTVTRVATGGEGVARRADGKAVFVRGALPGERVTAVITDERARFARADVVEVLDAAAGRVTPPCPQVAAGCGGCDWQHVEPALQRKLKAGIVDDALRRLGGIEPPALAVAGEQLTGGRTTVRAVIDDMGRAGFRRYHAHTSVDVAGTGCIVSHPLVDEVLRDGRFGRPVTEVTVRAGARTGARLVLADPKLPAGGVEVPEGTLLVGGDELAAGRRAWITEFVGGHPFRVSAGSFFQSRPDGAEALVEVVRAAARPEPTDDLIDLYGGVGLFAALLPVGGRATVVEANRSAVADARVNLADRPGARVIRADVRRWQPSPANVVVADPSRHGLGREVVERIGATGATRLALVSCDAGALGRDAGLLARAGWRLDTVVLVDQFPHTAHIEAVTAWERESAATPNGSGT